MADGDGSPPLVPRSPGGDWGRPHHAADPRRILRLPLVALAPSALPFLPPPERRDLGIGSSRPPFILGPFPTGAEQRPLQVSQATHKPTERRNLGFRSAPRHGTGATPELTFFLKYNRIQFPFSEQIRIRSWPPQIRGRIRGEASGGGPAICEHGPAPESFGTGTSLPPFLSSRKHREKKTVRIHLQMFRN